MPGTQTLGVWLWNYAPTLQHPGPIHKLLLKDLVVLGLAAGTVALTLKVPLDLCAYLACSQCS